MIGRLIRKFVYQLPWTTREQVCGDCWRTDGIDFWVPTAMWNSVMAPESWIAGTYWQDRREQSEGYPGVLCLECFDRRALQRSIDYTDALAVMGRRAWLANGTAMQRVRYRRLRVG